MFDTLKFDNRFTRELPADPETENYTRQVTGACFSRVSPTPVALPELIVHSSEMALELGMSRSDMTSEAFAEVFGGNRVAKGMEPFAMCYGGHQFGHWAGQLGDGRAINLGEIVNSKGRRWMLQLKGAGPTPYSRSGDGFAVLRSSIREFLCSEAMHHLGIPTTRALSLVLTGEQVERDMFYDGNPVDEPGAVVCRVSPSFTRFGHFEIFAQRQDIHILKQLVDYTIETDFPHLGARGKDTYLEWFDEVCRRTADLIVHWMRVGFVHGVMNTDNMSILGLTIDYGPYGWLENYDPNWTPNTTDSGVGRYRFGNQPRIAHWNLSKLGQALSPLIREVKPLREIISAYRKYFDSKWQQMMAHKLGLSGYVSKTDDELISNLHNILQLAETDMTIFFRNLADVDLLAVSKGDPIPKPLRKAYYVDAQITPALESQVNLWLKHYRERTTTDDPHSRRERMNRMNPKYVLRNYLAQLAIDKSEQGDHTMISELLGVLRHPYTEQPGAELYAERRPNWARHRSGCSMLSCSS